MIARIYKILRLIIVLVLLLIVAIPAMLYVGLSLPSVQNYASGEAGRRLSDLLGVEVKVGNLAITPFNKATLRNVTVTDSDGDTIAKALRLGAGFGLTDFIFHKKIVLNYVEAVGLDLRVYRDSAGAPLNIQPIISRLNKPGGDGGVPDLLFNTIIIRRSRVSYDVLSEMPKPLGDFDASHIAIDDLRADLRVVLNKKDRNINVDIRRLAAEESRSGLTLVDLASRFTLQKAPAPSGAITSVISSGVDLSLPRSHIAILTDTIDLGKNPSGKVSILGGSYVCPADLDALLPAESRVTLANLLDSRINVMLSGSVCDNSLNVGQLMIGVGNGAVTLEAPSGLSIERYDSIDKANISLPGLLLNVNPSASMLMPYPGIATDSVTGLLLPLTAEIQAEGSMKSGMISFNLDSREAGNVIAEIEYGLNKDRGLEKVNGTINTDGLNLYEIASFVERSLGRSSGLPYKLPRFLSSSFEGTLSFARGEKIPTGSVTGLISRIDLSLRNDDLTSLTDITIDVLNDRGVVEASVESANDGFALDIDVTADLASRSGSFEIVIDDLDLLQKGKEHLSLTSYGQIALQPAGAPLPFTGDITFHDILLATRGESETDRKLSLSTIEIRSNIPEDSLSTPEINISSDIFKASLRGCLNVDRLLPDLKEIASVTLPSLVESINPVSKKDAAVNSFTLSGRLLSTAPLESMVKLPVQVRYPINFEMSLNAPRKELCLNIDAPYLWQGKKEIDSTRISISAIESSFQLEALTRMPTKNGMMDLKLISGMPAVGLVADSIRSLSTKVTWKVDAERDFSGLIDLDILPFHNPANDRELMATIDFNQSTLTFNDSVWTMSPSRIELSKSRIDVDGFRVGRTGQYVEIDGTVTASHADSLAINLAEVDLDYVFETLNIPNAMFGGVASGKLYASGLLGPEMVAYTPDLFVRGLKYNFSVMGDTHIKASFDPHTPAVNIDAKVDQPNGKNSFITGYIKPTSEGYIDLDFKADQIEVGFMKPFMSAFASAVHGYASGDAHLFGTFHDVNMSGDIFAEDLSLALDFTGTTYWATDSVHLMPGYIDLDGISLRDRDGHTAMLNGYLIHTNFHEPRFEFRITDADDLLVYDLPSSPDRRWYGTIYGDGSATVKGVPGRIDIGVTMTTAPHSSFTFVLSDAEEAYDYNFISFRDRDKGDQDPMKEAALLNGIPDEVAEIRKTLANKIEEEGSSIYDMVISVTVNPDALLTVVMDPVGGDAIKARGNGALTMTYNSASEDLGLRGDYTLDNGTYNFTFQDIIRKDFRINPGSTIRFTGDPYAAQLDIEAAYRLTANLSDLDESFLDDPELTRTTVPVDALINVKGDMRAPELAYDFAFPTLKDDVKRKVNSIVSTDEMRARQMLYLLALNRFYTPEYMSATKGNELFSVASSTISSQMSNLLGSLAENWTIAPNLRSDRGDFSDVEFDLALSSSLLNNRLLFNGNFGYRDKSLNNNTFIGDFDLEYLLNNSGTLRLKAYNRYNDQNFYVKNALTTQGVGIVFRKDFDSFNSWLKALRRKKNDKQPDTGAQKEKVTND